MPMFLFYVIGFEDQFSRLSTQDVTTNGIDYDYYSIMHYNAYAFSRNGQPTITPIDKNINVNELGQRRTLTENDLKHIERVYCTENHCRLTSHLFC